MSRRGQAVVEVLALAPLIGSLMVAFAVTADRIAEQARAQRVAEAERVARVDGEPRPSRAELRRGQATVVVVAVALPLSLLAVQALVVLAARTTG